MATLRAKVENIREGERELEQTTSHYLLRVLRLAVGDSFVGFDPHSKMEARAELVRADNGKAVARFEKPTAANVVAPFDVWWIHSLAKGDKVDAIVRDATELGATHILLARTARSVVKLDDDKSDKKRQRWQTIADEAARQCGRSDPPTIAGPFAWEEALSLPPPDAAKFLLYEGASAPLAHSLRRALDAGQPLAFCAGPEGGLTDEEVNSAVARGYENVSLGKFILRTETVSAAVLGAVRIFAEKSPK